jgi:hypothetical protein
VSANVAWAASATGTRRMRIVHSSDGAIAADSRPGLSGINTQMALSCEWYFAAGNYCYIEVWQNSTGTLAIDGTTNTYLPAFSMVRVGV